MPPATFAAGRLPAVALTTVLLPETVATVTFGPARLVVPPERLATAIVLVLFIVTNPPETPSDVLPTVAWAPTVTPLVKLLLTTFRMGEFPALMATMALPATLTGLFTEPEPVSVPEMSSVRLPAVLATLAQQQLAAAGNVDRAAAGPGPAGHDRAVSDTARAAVG